jgi:hypothetical protein
MGSIGLTVSKLHSKQLSKVELKMPDRPVILPDPVGQGLVTLKTLTGVAQKTEPFLPNFDSWATRHQIRWNLDTRVTSIQGIYSQKWFFPSSKIFLSILD